MLRKMGKNYVVIASDMYEHKLRFADVELLSRSFFEFRNDPYRDRINLSNIPEKSRGH